MGELNQVTKQLKREKAPEPKEVPNEVLNIWILIIEVAQLLVQR